MSEDLLKQRCCICKQNEKRENTAVQQVVIICHQYLSCWLLKSSFFIFCYPMFHESRPSLSESAYTLKIMRNFSNHLAVANSAGAASCSTLQRNRTDCCKHEPRGGGKVEVFGMMVYHEHLVFPSSSCQ